MALEDDLAEAADELEETSEAASLLGDVLGGLPDVMAQNTSALAALTQTVADLTSAMGAASEKTPKVASGMQTAIDRTRSVTSAMREGAQAIQAVGAVALDLANGPLPSAGQAMTALGETLSGAITSGAHKAAEALSALGPEGAAAGAVLEALAGVASATVGTLLTLAGIAVEVTEKLALMTARFSALGGGAAMGAKTLAMVQQLGQALPFATAKIGEWAMSLQRAGIQGRELEAATRAAAASEAIGAGGAEATTSLIKKLAEGGKGAESFLKALQEGGGRANKMLEGTGVTAAEVAKAIGKTPEQFAKMKLSAADAAHAIEAALAVKGKDPLAAMAGGWENIIGKAREGFMSLFSGLAPAVEPFMAAVKSLFGEFNKGGAATNAIKPILTAVLSTVFSWATKAVTAVHGIVTWLLASGKAGGVFSGVVNVIKTTWAALGAIFDAVVAYIQPVIAAFQAILANATVMAGIKQVFTGIAVAIGLVVGIVAVLIAAWVVVQVTVVAVAGAVVAAVMWIVGEVRGLGDAIVDGLSALDPSAFVAKMKELALSGLAAFKGIFGIHSPSTVMLEHGEENIAGAAATGVDKGGAKVDKAMAKMGPKLGGGGAKDGGAGAGFVAHFTNCVFGGSLTQADVDEMMASWWERQAAGGPGAEPT